MKLKKGITFHNGKTLTADDVVATINYHTGKDSKSPAKAVLSNLVSVKADGPDTVIFELNGGNADFPYLLSDYHLAMYPSEGGQIQWDKGIGAKIEAGKVGFRELEAYMLKKGEADASGSGRQEFLENLINEFIV